jgi:hypothetical protein
VTAALVLGERPLRVEDVEAVAFGRRSIPATLEDRAMEMEGDIDAARELVAGGALWTLLGEPAC